MALAVVLFAGAALAVLMMRKGPAPLPDKALLIVKSQPPAPTVHLLQNGAFSSDVPNDPAGISLPPGSPVNVAISLPDYLPVNSNLPALVRGQTVSVDFGQLTPKPGALRLKVQPEDATFTLIRSDGARVPFGSAKLLTGLPPQTDFQIVAEHPDYVSQTKPFKLRPNETNDFDFGQLQPLRPATPTPVKPILAKLIIHSSPYVNPTVTTADGSPVTPRSDGEGYDVSPGVAVRVSIDSAAYESAATNLPALPPGSTTIVDFGSLPLKKSALRLNARPYDSDYSMLTEGSASPVPVSAFIMNIAPRTFFSVIARHPGYVSKTNQFNLPPNVTNDFDFGQLEPLRTLLRVSASPRPFHLQVAWAGGDREFDNTEEVSGLPARQQITVTASAPDYEPVYKTVMLNPGETLDLDLGSMASALGFLLIQSAPAAESLTYVIDNNSFSRQGAGPIENLRLHRLVTVTTHKPGYADKTLAVNFERSGQVLDFGSLERQWGTLTVHCSPAGASVSALIDGEAAPRNGSAPLELARVPLGVRVSLEISAPNYVTQNLVHVLSGLAEEQYVTLQPVEVQRPVEIPKPDPVAGLTKECQDALLEIANGGQVSPSVRRARIKVWEKWKEENQSAIDSSPQLRDAYEKVIKAINLNAAGGSGH